MGLDELRALRLRDTFHVALGQDGFWGDAVHADIEWSGLGGSVLGEEFDASFSRRVRNRRSGMGPSASRGRYGDDVSCAPLLHAWEDALEREKGRGEVA